MPRFDFVKSRNAEFPAWEMLSEEHFERLKEFFRESEYTEYDEMTYEQYREMTLEQLELSYPGISDMFDSDGTLRNSDESDLCEYFRISFLVSHGADRLFDNQTLIKEGLKAIFDNIASDSGYKKLKQSPENNNGFIFTTASIMYDGGYTLSYSSETYISISDTPAYPKTEGRVYLGKAKIYETAPDTTTHYVIPADSPFFEWINTDDNPYEMSLDIVADGYYADTIYIDESGYSNVKSNDAILGVISEIEIGEFGTKQNEKIKQVWVKFIVKAPYRDNSLGTFAAKEPELKGIKRSAQIIEETIPHCTANELSGIYHGEFSIKQADEYVKIIRTLNSVQ